MTAISEIHGHVPRNEFAHRGLEARGGIGYIPYLSLTKGEMRLALLQEQARIYAKAFPENREYRRAATMLENALYAGVSRGVNFVGALYEPTLQQVAREISRASRQTKPASRAGFMGRDSIITGIGEIFVDIQKHFFDCMKAAGGDAGKRHKCYVNLNIEKAINNKIKEAGHHMLYKSIRQGDKVTATVIAKGLNHRLGIEGLALAADLDSALMDTWVETMILKRNAESASVGPLDSRASTFAVRDVKMPKIGCEVACVTAIVTIIAAATAAAKTIIESLRSQKAYAMSEVKGFGTNAYGPEDLDWGGDGSGSSNTLLLLGAAAAGYLLLNDN